jgi:hypothetical protein
LDVPDPDAAGEAVAGDVVRMSARAAKTAGRGRTRVICGLQRGATLREVRDDATR